MRNPLKKIIAVFILMALLPVGFMVYELSTLNKNERIIREIYQNQLDAILYSINQYCDDVVSGWATGIGIAFQEQQGILPKDTVAAAGRLGLMNQLSGVQYFYISDLNGRSATYSVLENEKSQQEINLTLDNILNRNESEIKKLIRYHEAGFKKMETLDTVVSPELQPVF